MKNAFVQYPYIFFIVRFRNFNIEVFKVPFTKVYEVLFESKVIL